MKVLCAHSDFARVSLALTNCKSLAREDPDLRSQVEFLTVRGHPDDDPDQWIGEVLQAAAGFDPDVVALSVYVWSRYRMYRVTQELRDRFPNAAIVWGGPDVSDIPYAEELLKSHPAVDVIVRDEGERTFCRLLRHWLHIGDPLADIPGISYRDGDHIVDTGAVDNLDNLDVIPSILDAPEVSAILGELSDIALETFRGCYMGCAYCYWGGTRRRAFSDARVYSDLRRILHQRNIKKIWFFDSMFGFKKQMAKDMLRFIIAEKAPDQSITFFPNLDFLDDELCELMSEAGIYIEAGVQTINEEAYATLNRKWDRAFIESKMPLLEKHGLRANVQQLILGLPGDSLAGFFDSVDFVFRQNPECIMIFPFSVLPATGYWRQRDELGVRYEGEYRIVFHSRSFPEDDMVQGGYIMLGAKWYETHPGLAQRIVALLGCRPSEWFAAIGQAFVEGWWHLTDTPGSRPELRRRLLNQNLSAGDQGALGSHELILGTLQRQSTPAELIPRVQELLRLSPYLEFDRVEDLSLCTPRQAVARLQALQPSGELRWERAGFDVFRPDRWNTGDDRPVPFAAIQGTPSRDYFGRSGGHWIICPVPAETESVFRQLSLAHSPSDDPYLAGP